MEKPLDQDDPIPLTVRFGGGLPVQGSGRLSNDGDSDYTFSVAGRTITLAPGESVTLEQRPEGLVVINASDIYRAECGPIPGDPA